MDNSSYRSQYITSFTDKLSSESTIQSFIAIWNNINRAEVEMGYSLDSVYSKEDFIRLFSLLRISSISVFALHKHYIGKYLNFLQDDGIINSEAIDILAEILFEDLDASIAFDRKYFKDFDALQSIIDITLQEEGRYDDNVFATHICAIYFAWCGISCEDAMNMLKSDVYDDHIVVRGKKFYPHKRILQHIVMYCKLESYETTTSAYSSDARSVERKYKPSSYLFRTNQKAQFTNVIEFRNLLSAFGVITRKKYEITFTYESVFLSGLYGRVYMYEFLNGRLEAGEYDRINDAFEENMGHNRLLNRKLRDYQAFKKHFYGNI